jgi:hypothetical protein
LFAFVTVNFSKVFIWVNFEINQAELAQKYCINKDKPNMHCCGKCLLKKKMAEDDAKQQSPAMPDIKNDIQLDRVCKVYQVFKPNEVPYFQLYELYKLSPQSEGTGVFHPPCC